jgi:hypothetical protein
LKVRRRKDVGTEGSEVESVDLQRDMDRKEGELKARKAELERLEGTLVFSEAVKEEKWEMAAPEGEGLSVSSANEGMLNHLPVELIEEIFKMTVESEDERALSSKEMKRVQRRRVEAEHRSWARGSRAQTESEFGGPVWEARLGR